jgi:hypothetical protein
MRAKRSERDEAMRVSVAPSVADEAAAMLALSKLG